MAKMTQEALRHYAAVGAEKRLTELQTEIAQIVRAFPELRTGKRPAAAGQTPQPGRRRRRTISAEGRRRISEAQKARWARQRKATAARAKS